MRVCLVNVKNCINYSQYGPFLFEEIGHGDCVIYDAVNGGEDFAGLYDDLLAEYNRNAFGTDGIKLIFLIPRDMRNRCVEDEEFYYDMQIATQLLSRLPAFSEVVTVYLDICNDKYFNEEHLKSQRLREKLFSTDERFLGYLPICSEELSEKAALEKSISEIKLPSFREFFQKALSLTIAEKENRGNRSLLDEFAVRCEELMPSPKIEKRYEFIAADDIADNISKTLAALYFVKQLIENPELNKNNYDTHCKLDHAKIKTIVATYINRLRRQSKEKILEPEHPEATIKAFDELNEAAGFQDRIDDIVKKELDHISTPNTVEYDVVSEVFKKLHRIVKNADDELEKFSNSESEQFLSEDFYYEESAAEISTDKIDQENEINALLEKMNVFNIIHLPGFTEQIKLEQRLENINKKIQVLLKCRQEYTFKAFMSTFVFSVLAVILLYGIAQYSVFMKERAFWIFGLYTVCVSVAFLTVYLTVKNFYKRQIGQLLKKCKQEVKDFMSKYKELAEEFEENLNNAANYFCYQDYITRLNEINKQRDEDIKKIEWHQSKIKDLLTNIGHFNDYCIKAIVEEESKVPEPDINHDAEHSEFYQMKLFKKEG